VESLKSSVRSKPVNLANEMFSMNIDALCFKNQSLLHFRGNALPLSFECTVVRFFASVIFVNVKILTLRNGAKLEG